MIKTARFYVGIMIKNPIFLLSILFNLFLITIQLDVLESSLFEFSKVFCFGIICSNLFTIIVSTYIMHKDYEILHFLENNILKKQLSIIITSLFISTVTALLPILSIIIFKNIHFESIFVFKAILHFFTIWTLSNLTATTIGSSIGIVCRNGFSTLLSFAIYSLFLLEFYSPSNNPLYKLFNIFDDYTLVSSNDISGQLFNKSYYLDKLFVLFLSLFILSIIAIIYTNKKCKSILLSICIVFCLLATSYLSFNSRTVNLYGYKLMNVNNYYIQSYDMKLRLYNSLKNTCTIKLFVQNDVENISLSLDDSLKVAQVSIGDDSVEFTHKDNQLQINYPCTKESNLIISINYEGNINVENYLGIPTFYVSNHAINLPCSTFYWYPRLNNTALINFNIQVETSSKLYSNLPIESNDDGYILQGQSSGLNLFSGQYQTIENNGIEYIIPMGYNLDFFKLSLESLVSELSSKNNTVSERDLDLLKSMKFKKIIVAVWSDDIQNPNTHSSFQIFDETLLINYR